MKKKNFLFSTVEMNIINNTFHRKAAATRDDITTFTILDYKIDHNPILFKENYLVLLKL